MTRTIPLVLAGLAFTAPAAAKTETYTFRDTLQSTEGGAAGNTLQPVFNQNAAIVSTPAGTFVDTTLDAYACPSTPTVRGYSFPKYGGLRMLNTSPIIATGSYTISMIVKFHPLGTGYSRLVDFSKSTQDQGLYALNGSVSLFPSTVFAENTFLDDRFSVITLTRDAATNVVTAYVGNTKVGEHTDVNKLYEASGDLFFFMDNTTGSAAVNESSPGIVTLIRISDTPIAPTDLPAVVDRACAAAACGDGDLGTGEACDDGNNVDGDGCSSTCRVENGLACASLADAGANPKAASCASNVCDTDDLCGYANGATSTCTTANAATVCRSKSCGAGSGKCIAAGGCFADGDCAAGQTCDAATGTCSTSAGVPSDAGAVSFADAGLSFDTPVFPDDNGCSFVADRRIPGASAMLFVGVGAVIASVLRRRRR